MTRIALRSSPIALHPARITTCSTRIALRLTPIAMRAPAVGKEFTMGHKYFVAAYLCTWAIQLGYLAWIGAKWFSQRSKL